MTATLYLVYFYILYFVYYSTIRILFCLWPAFWHAMFYKRINDRTDFGPH